MPRDEGYGSNEAMMREANSNMADMGRNPGVPQLGNPSAYDGRVGSAPMPVNVNIHQGPQNDSADRSTVGPKPPWIGG